MMDSAVYRMIAVYVPHSGFGIDEFNLCMTQLHSLVADAEAQNYRICIGGDFNLQTHMGD